MNQVFLSDVYWFQEGPGVRNWQFKDSGIKLLNVANITKQGKIDLDKTDRHLSTEEVDSKYQHFLIDEGDLVIASSGITNDEDNLLRTKIAFIEKQHLPLCLNTSTIRFKAKDGVSDLSFLRHWLNSLEFRQQITKEVTGIAQKNFGPSHLKKIKISLPQLAEQRRIASILNQVDALRQKRQQAIEKLDQLLQATFIDMFGDPVSNPKGWDKDELQNICKQVIDCPHSTPTWGNEGIICLRTSNLGKGEWIWDDTRYVSPVEYKERTKRSEIFAGDIILSREGTVGIAAIVPNDLKLSLGQRLVQLTPRLDKINSEFLLQVLLYDLDPIRISSLMVGSTSKHINVKDLRALKLFVPPMELQNKFCIISSRIFEQKKDLKASLSNIDNLFNSLQNQAFNGTL